MNKSESELVSVTVHVRLASRPDRTFTSAAWIARRIRGSSDIYHFMILIGLEGFVYPKILLFCCNSHELTKHHETCVLLKELTSDVNIARVPCVLPCVVTRY